MSTQSLALSAAEAVSEEDYQAFLAALSASARGRAFLDEHARRQRETDTASLLETVARLETHLASQPSAADIAHQLNALAETVRSLSSQIDAVQLTAAVTQLAATLQDVQQRLPVLTGARAPEPQSEPLAEAKPVQPPFSLALTAVAAQALAAAEMVEEPIKVFKAGTIPPPVPFAGEDFAASDFDMQAAADEERAGQDEHAIPPSGTGDDPMLQLMALSEEERLALFT